MCQCCMVWETSDAWMMCSMTMVARRAWFSSLDTSVPEKALSHPEDYTYNVRYLQIVQITDDTNKTHVSF